MKSTEKLRCLVLLSGRGSNLAAMVAAQNNKRLPIDICAAISNRIEAKGLDIARSAGIPAIFIDPMKFTERKSYDQELSRQIQLWQPDLVVLAGFMRILSASLVNRYKGKIINLHPSLLPKYTGLDTYNRALTAGDSHYGASIHFVTPELDAGALIAQTKLAITADDTATTMANRLQPIEHQLLLSSLELFSLHTVSLRDDKLNIDGTTYEKPLQMATNGHLVIADGQCIG